jgi:hypothetical protein
MDILTLAISIIALLVSGLAAYRSYALNEYQVRLNSRLEFNKLLLEINKAALADPSLLSIYDEFSDVPADPKKLWVFAYMNLNVFETVFTFYWDSDRIRAQERSSYETWIAFLRNIIETSEFARHFLKQPQVRQLYHPKLIHEIDEILRNIEFASSDADSATATDEPDV